MKFMNELNYSSNYYLPVYNFNIIIIIVYICQM